MPFWTFLYSHYKQLFLCTISSILSALGWAYILWLKVSGWISTLYEMRTLNKTKDPRSVLEKKEVGESTKYIIGNTSDVVLRTAGCTTSPMDWFLSPTPILIIPQQSHCKKSLKKLCVMYFLVEFRLRTFPFIA